MPDKTRIVAPGPRPGTVRLEDGSTTSPPADWELLPPGDVGLTRRVKAGGATWTVMSKRGRRSFSQGIWAPSERIAAARAILDAERETDAYKKRRVADTARRERAQDDYVATFRRSVLDFLAFPPRHVGVAVALAEAVTTHATPVGSGTVARTERIPVEERAEAAVIAWMRHQTTAYDHLSIPRVKGKRRQVRRMLAQASRDLLGAYRRGEDVEAGQCPLQRALAAQREG